VSICGGWLCCCCDQRDVDMRLFPDDNVEDPCDCVGVDHCDGAVSSLLPNDIIAGSVHGRFIHRSFGTNMKR
jgi:hypothetical protein